MRALHVPFAIAYQISYAARGAFPEALAEVGRPLKVTAEEFRLVPAVLTPHQFA
jgi:hypothetical protein